MPVRPAVRPRRSLVVPTATVAAPPAYAVFRDIDDVITLGHAGALCGSLLLGYFVAAAVLAVVDTERLAARHWLVAQALDPDTATLALFGVGVVGATGYLAAATTVGLPTVVTTLLTPVGALLGLPLIVLYGGTVAAGNAVGAEPALAWQWLAVGLGVALSVIWTFTVSALVVRLTGRFGGASDRRL